MIVFGERINSSRKPIALAIEQGNAAFIRQEAALQAQAGAEYIDVNAGVFADREAECLKWLAGTVQEAVDVPLCLDSTSPEALEAALSVSRRRPVLNSINCQERQFQALLPLVKSYGCAVVALCVDDSGIPDTVEDRLGVACRVIDGLAAAGVAPDSIFVDPVLQPIAVSPGSGAAVLGAIARIKSARPGVRAVCGVSNVSFGMPSRQALNRAFLLLALEAGLDAAIVDPCDRQLMAGVLAAEALLGKDRYGMRYIRAFREGRL